MGQNRHDAARVPGTDRHHPLKYFGCRDIPNMP